MRVLIVAVVALALIGAVVVLRWIERGTRSDDSK